MSDLQAKLRFKKTDDEDWTKLEDKALRKRIQNRLAKRKSRTTSTVKFKPRKKKFVGISEDGKVLTKRCESQGKLTSTSPSSEVTQVVTVAHHRENTDAKLRAYLELPGLAEHRFVCLMQYSLLRAFLQNADILAIDPLLLADDDAISPWTLSHPYPALAPHTLSPTPVQLCTPHHPYLDMIAPPSLRDNILLVGLDDKQEEQFCYEMHSDSFTVWGSQPWNSLAWEVSQQFVDRWAWLMDEETIRCSDFWRAERGEPPLVLPDFGARVVDELA